MDAVPVACNSCGAPLEVPANIRFVTCVHCHSQLAVKSTGSATYTEVLEELNERTQRVEERLETITIQNEIERIDREWEREREELMTSDEHGRRHAPNSIAGMMGGVGAFVGGVILLVVAGQEDSPDELGVLAVLLFIAGIVITAVGVARAGDYERVEKAYLRRRQKAVDKLARASGPATSAPVDAS